MRTDAATGAPRGRLWLRVDERGVTTRLEVEAGGWVLRGGCLGDEVLWRRGDEEASAAADGFTGTSPAYALAAVRRLRLAVGESRRLRLVEVTEPVLATRLVEQVWTRTGPDAYEAADLATGDVRRLRLEGDRVVRPG